MITEIPIEIVKLIALNIDILVMLRFYKSLKIDENVFKTNRFTISKLVDIVYPKDMDLGRITTMVLEYQSHSSLMVANLDLSYVHLNNDIRYIKCFRFEYRSYSLWDIRPL